MLVMRLKYNSQWRTCPIGPGSIVDGEYPPLSLVAKLPFPELKKQNTLAVTWQERGAPALECHGWCCIAQRQSCGITRWHRRVGRCLAGNLGVKGADRRLLLLGQMALNLCGSKCAMSSETDICSIKQFQLMQNPTDRPSKVTGEGE